MSASTYLGDYCVEVTTTSPTRWEWIAASLGDANVCTCEIHLPDLSYEERLEVDRVLARRDRERLEITSDRES